MEAITATELGRKTRASRRGDAVSDARRRRLAEDRRGRSAAAVRRRSDERTRCEFLPHRCTHTHTWPSPARHARPPRTLHQLGATPTASPPPSPHAQVETTSNSARTCRSKQRAIRRERAERVDAQIVWARGSGARMLGGHTGRARKCAVFGCGSACGRRTARALQDGRCPGRSVSTGRSVRRTVDYGSCSHARHGQLLRVRHT